MSEDFGSYLKHERELRGVPLDDIAQSTKISVRFLRALEEGRFEDLPGEVFIKGFIRSYGQAIGSNVDELLAAYHESGAKRQDTKTPSTEISPSREESSEEPPFVFPTKAVLGFVAALLIIGGGAYWLTSNKAEKAVHSSQETRSTSTVDNSLPEVEDEAESPVSEEATPLPSETESPTPEPGSSDVAEPAKPPAQPSPAEPQTRPRGRKSLLKIHLQSLKILIQLKTLRIRQFRWSPPLRWLWRNPR